MFRLAVACTASLIAASSALAQGLAPEEEAVRQLLSRGEQNAQEHAINKLFSMAPTGELTREMAETVDLRLKARTRRNLASTILLNDLDGSGDLSSDEVARVRQVLSGHERSSFEAAVLKIDANKDEALSEAEIAVWLEAMLAEGQGLLSRRSLEGSNFMVFDADGDGVVVVSDIVATIARIRAQVPAPMQQPQASPRAAACTLPKPSAEAAVVYVGVYEGSAVSTVAVAGLDRETSFATLNIEDGDSPLYIVLNVYDALVVRVTGATDRVERFVGGSRSGIGVVGLPKEKLDLTSLKNCSVPRAHNPDSIEGVKAKAVLSAELGRSASMVGSYELGRMDLPSGRSETSKKARQGSGGLVIQKGNRRFQMTEDGIEEVAPTRKLSGLEQSLLRFYPGGIQSVMPEDVIASGKVEAYDVLPQQAGLLQLVQSGALRILSDGSYSIDQPIARFPAGLNGAHSVKFILRRGVPMPAGSPGHSAVVIEETGNCIGARC